MAFDQTVRNPAPRVSGSLLLHDELFQVTNRTLANVPFAARRTHALREETLEPSCYRSFGFAGFAGIG